MRVRKEIHILVDASLKMHVKIDHQKTPMNKVNNFLLHLAKMSDLQPAYFGRVHIHIGDVYIPVEEGKAEKMIRDAEKVMNDASKENDLLFFWNSVLSGDGNDDNLFFIISSVVDDRLLSMFENYKNKLIFLDFSGKKIDISPEHKRLVHVVKHRDVKKCAKKIHKRFLSEYLTTVNFGFLMKTEFFPVLLHEEDDYDLESIKVIATSTFQPLESISILAKGFIMPVDQCYDKKGTKVNSAAAYKILKALLGEEINPKVKEEDTSLDANKDDSVTIIEDESRAEKVEEATAEVKQEVKEEVMEEDEIKEEEVKEEKVKEDVEEEVKPVLTTPAKKSRKRKAIGDDDDDDDDEEYTPTKRKSTRKPAKASGRGGKRKAVKEHSPASAKKAATPGRGRKAKKLVEEEPEKEDEPMEEEQAEEPEKAEEKTEEQQADTKEEVKPAEVVEEIPEPVFLVACASERHTGIRRPVILRLRGLEQQDKTYYDEETRKLKIAEKAAAAEAEAAEQAAKEEAARQEAARQEAANMEYAQQMAMLRQYEYERAQQNAPMATPMEDDSPESPPPYDCPASPDMAPATAQDVKIIPTIATIPLEPEAQEPEEPDEPDEPEEPSGDVDFRTTTPIKMIPLEAVGTEESSDKSADQGSDKSADQGSDKSADQNELNVSSESADNSGGIELKESTCIVDESDVPEEPEDLLKVQNTPVKTIPVDSCVKANDGENQSESVEEAAVKEEDEKYIEVIVLNMTWEKFREQVALADDEEAIEELTERELEMPGVEPMHDYTKLTGWYSSEAMQFYLNKLFRAMRKLHDRRPLYDNEIRNMKQMVQYGQSANLAWNFSMLLRDEDNVVPEDFLPLLESTAQEFDKLYYEISKRSPMRRPALPRRFQHHHPLHHQPHYSPHYQSAQQHARHAYGHNPQHYNSPHHGSPHSSPHHGSPHKKYQQPQHHY
ncbi:hypothetical protein GCK72_024496 [Caenorhabditis remanei]|uniref:Uncharacterized protein n=1 Tax=Caenorhabditis remanei TaxID=31234 RepID=A0A6A5G0D9_CAERE|nr:hypothetical protein GCK72_024496 [Caenorhabditis remanei]KAF1748029.1 hypothetical protein GCK72_024496 [Caenorhabditis remanei]